MEAESEAGEESELVVGGLHARVVEAVDQRGIDASLMRADAAGQLDKGSQTAACHHRRKALQLHARVATRVAEDFAQLLLEEVGAKQGLIVLFDFRELAALLLGEAFGIFAQRPARALEGLGLLLFRRS